MPAPQKNTTTGINVVHEDCWAKTMPDGAPGLSVRDHCLNVGCVAEALLASLLPHVRTILPTGSVSLAALHDVGKVSPGFQAKCPAWLAKKNIHSAAVSGCENDHARISQSTLQDLAPDSLRLWAAVVGAHHGRVKGDRVPPITESNHEVWVVQRNRLVDELTDIFGSMPVEPGDEASRWITAGLITVADWIGSDETLFPQTWTVTMHERRQRAIEALRVVGWEAPSFRDSLAFWDLFPAFRPNSLQEAIWNNKVAGSLHIIEGPMGYGKTEAALAAAYRSIAAGQATGVYFALPTQVTSNRVHIRVRLFLERALKQSSELRLIHGTSWLTEPAPLSQLRPSVGDDPEAVEHVRVGWSWFASAKRAILAPFGVGTVDQALLGVVAAKHFFVRQFGLAGKVVILDEIHTYDLYTSTLIDVLIRRLLELRCTVIVLSGTLTIDRRRQLLALAGCESAELSTAYPLLSCVSPTLEQCAVEPPPSKSVAVCFPRAEKLIEACLRRAQQGECVLWIRNTVQSAQETFGQLKSANREGGPEVALLHSRFPQFRRAELETTWMERLGKDGTGRPPNGCVLVSTQVAEQSVDIDADLLITDIAPTDMILQRIGRLWRHERSRRCPRAEIWIQPPVMSAGEFQTAAPKDLVEAFGKSSRVYAPYVLLRSWQQWQNRQIIKIPADIREILEATYTDTAGEPPAWCELREQVESKKGKLGSKALNATNIWSQPSLPDDEGVQTRFTDYQTASLLVAREIETVDPVSVRLTLLNGDTLVASGRDRRIETARALHRNLVPMPRWAVQPGLASNPDWVRLHVAQPTAIAMLQSSGALVFWRSDGDTRLSYCPERGVLIAKLLAAHSQKKWDEDESYD